MLSCVRRPLKRISLRLKSPDLTKRDIEDCLRRLSRLQEIGKRDADTNRQIRRLVDKALDRWREVTLRKS